MQQENQFNNNVLKLYGLQDKLTGITTMFMTAYNDKAALDSYLQYINDIFKSLKSEKERTKFLKAVHQSQCVRVCSIDVTVPTTENDYQNLADFKDIVLDMNNDRKKEKK